MVTSQKILTAVFEHENHANLHSEQTFGTLPNTSSILIDAALPPKTGKTEARCIE